MEQQVNLYQPILRAEKRIFSARAIGGSLLTLAACLGGLHAFGAWRTGRIERSVAIIERQVATETSLRDGVSAALRPSRSIVELQAQALELIADIAARERALDLVNRDTASPATGFAARLEALGRRQIDGLWLRTIVVGSGDGLLALQGATVDRRLVPQYLAALAEERAFDGVRFDKLAIRQARREESPAQLMFELGAAGLDFPAPETRK
jgi:Tfp pilus assembly protein PilN